MKKSTFFLIWTLSAVLWAAVSVHAAPCARSDTIWEPLYGPWGGSLSANSLAVNARGDLYIGTENAGVLFSADIGAHWQSTGLRKDLIHRVGINVNGDIYAVLQKELAPPNEVALLRSSDNGKTWTNTGFLFFTGYPFNVNLPYLYDLQFSNEGHVFVVTDYGIFRSTDHGASWVLIGLGGPLKALSLRIGKQGIYFAHTRNDGIFRSANGGNGWNFVGLGDEALTNIALDQEGYLFAGSKNGLFYSSNAGSSWNQAGFARKETDILGIDAQSHIFIRVRGEAVPDTFFRSTDHGSTWEAFRPPDALLNFTFGPDGRMYALCRERILFSTDDGNTWADCSKHLVFSNIFSMALYKDSLLAALHWGGMGLSLSADAGVTWTDLPVFGWFKIVITPEGHFFMASLCGFGCLGIIRSTDMGKTWTQVPTFGCCGVGFPLYLSASGHLFSGFSEGGKPGILRSADNGNSWSPVGPRTFPVPINAFYAGESGLLVAGGMDGTIYRSLNDGMNWDSAFIANTPVSALIATGRKTILAGTENGLLFQSPDSGATWTQVGHLTGGIRDFAVRNTGQIFVATDQSGIFASSDNGLNWYPYNEGLTNLEITSLVNSPQDVLFAGTHGSGVFVNRSIVTKYNDQLQVGLLLSQNAPNPFQGETTIAYLLPQAGQVALRIFDMQGREIDQLVNAVQQPGAYNVIWHAGHIPPGIYLYQLRVNGYAVAKRCIVF